MSKNDLNGDCMPEVVTIWGRFTLPSSSLSRSEAHCDRSIYTVRKIKRVLTLNLRRMNIS